MCNDKKAKTRKEIDSTYKWNIEAMYPDEAKWETDVQSAEKLAKEFSAFRGRLSESAAVLLSAYETRDRIWLLTEHAYTYAHMKKDEDNTDSKYQSMLDRCQGLIARVSAALSFFTPELISIPEDRIHAFLTSEQGLSTYAFAILDTLREKAHVLTHAEENILAQLSEVTCGPDEIFTMLNNADMKFGSVTDEDGDAVELTHGRYIGFLESRNRQVREDAFRAMYQRYKEQIHTLAATYSFRVKTDVISARIRKYPSALAAALSGDNIPETVYTGLIDIVNQNLPVLHKYLALRKRLLNVKELHMYDVYVPLIDIPDKKQSFSEALDVMRKGLAPLGSDYIARMNKGIADGWIDVYENTGKTSGAYSFGCYDSMPYILLNYQDKFKDVFTIVHEMGHSMHSSYTRETQPFIYGSHSIFTAETASTVNESLLMKYLIETEPALRPYLINTYIEEFRTTLFRQTMFAEFELMTHRAVEAGEVLTADYLCDIYGKLNEKYFGPDVFQDEEIRYEWARIPHFYNAFYVYKYATGYSAAAAISDLILKNGSADYIEFLKTGDSNWPIELLKIAGIDMSTPAPVEAAMNTFSALVDELEKLTR